MDKVIPKEIWVKIWGQVDFKSRQKLCTLVCKDWFEGIRGSTSLSGQMALNNEQKSLEDINLVLSHWEKLRIVRMSHEMSNDELFQLATHPSLKKIIFPKEFELGIWGKVTKVCFDLKNKSSVTNVENIIELHLENFFDEWHSHKYDSSVRNEVHQPFLKRFKTEDISLESIARMMSNLETLHVSNEYEFHWLAPDKMKYFGGFFRGLQQCKNLSEMILHIDIGEYATFVPNIKKLTIWGRLECDLEDLYWIANFKKLEILKLEMMRLSDKETNVEELTRKMFGKLTNLKSLELDDCSLMYEPDFLMNINEIIPSLETLIMLTGCDLSFPMNIDYLVEVLDSIGNIKHLYIKDYYETLNIRYLVNNQDFGRTLPNNFDEIQVKAIFQTALEIINKKFSFDSTSFEIVDSEYGWTIKKDKEKPPTMTQLCYKCTVKDEEGITCAVAFAEKAKLEKHETKDEQHYSHNFPTHYL